MRFSKKSFDKWLAKQRATREFLYIDGDKCLIARWLQETGVCATPLVYPWSVNCNGAEYDFPLWLRRVNGVMVNVVRTRVPEIFTAGEFRKANKTYRVDSYSNS